MNKNFKRLAMTNIQKKCFIGLPKVKKIIYQPKKLI